MNLTLADIEAKVRELKEVDAKLVKLVVFHSEDDLNRVVRNLTKRPELPACVTVWDVPQFIVLPALVKPGTALAVADSDMIDAILTAHRQLLAANHKPESEP